MTIENMSMDDYDELYQMWSGTHGMTLRTIDDSKEGIERLLTRNPTHNFVCRIDGHIVGGILCGHDGRKGCIYHAVVQEHYRKRGIGKALVECVIQSLKEEHITKIGIVVNADNLSGNSFWEALGFEHFDDLVYRILPIDELNM
jgi:ribosomal protein S18 acetylase RimI-like enzyme